MVYVAVTFRSLLGTWDLFWSSHGITREISIHLLPVPSHDPPESIYLYSLSYKVLHHFCAPHSQYHMGLGKICSNSDVALMVV